MLLKATVRKVLVNGDQWAYWHGYHIPVSDEYVVIWTPAGSAMRWRPGTWISQKHQLTYFWPDAWYAIHIGYDLKGNFLSGYCDVVLPTSNYSNSAQELSYTDLYIDVVVREDFSVYTKDQEVFDWAAKRYPVVERSRTQAFAVLAQLEEQARHWTGPFTHLPRTLPRSDFLDMDPDEAASVLRALHS